MENSTKTHRPTYNSTSDLAISVFVHCYCNDNTMLYEMYVKNPPPNIDEKQTMEMSIIITMICSRSYGKKAMLEICTCNF